MSAIAESEIQQALAGRRSRGEQDEMLRIEATLPGFGGIYRDSLGNVVAYMKDTTAASVARTRAVLAATYGQRTEPAIREATERVAETVVLKGEYSLSELVGMQTMVETGTLPIPGLVGVGADIRRNGLFLAFLPDADMSRAISLVGTLGVPSGAVRPLTLPGRPMLIGTWT